MILVRSLSVALSGLFIQETELVNEGEAGPKSILLRLQSSNAEGDSVCCIHAGRDLTSSNSSSGLCVATVEDGFLLGVEGWKLCHLEGVGSRGRRW